MANLKDNNSDLGNQTIEGTSPPDALDAIIVMPNNDSQPVPDAEPVIVAAAPSAAELDAQLDALINGDNNAQPVTPDPAPDLDAQLEALMAEPVIVAEPVVAAPATDDVNLDAMLDDLLKSDNDAKPDGSSDGEIPTSNNK